MTETITLPDVEAIEHLDSDPVCQFAVCNFGRPPATHIAYLPCGCEPLACTPSAEELHRDILRAIRLTWGRGQCRTCLTLIDGSKIRIEPLP